MKQLAYLLSVGLFLIVMSGCEKPSVPDSFNKDPIVSNQDFDPEISRLFTGRDSFGVAMIAKVSGAVDGTPATEECVNLNGTGYVTHLGKTTIIQSACIDGEGNIAGNFDYKGRTGGHIAGAFEGTLDGNKLETNVTVESVNNINALPEELPEEEEKWGGGTMEGILTETEFQYNLDGWLFHHESK